ncbi:hypothetical protein [Parerythrobacter jejuensis]|uniref:Uncharacterized protein n=1 Tax=Parerythrobacter jejuensis TaxID=795812 RepID=A0A845AUJ2_9SPHN|nr:hypothetical protein [Parerythrobacter jejuensis]MXP30409.1 hypothetical protein [Parerythrobacter jejuensis]MXP33169.1 hypothetical protein [Parerythrobacter jejuensis]
MGEGGEAMVQILVHNEAEILNVATLLLLLAAVWKGGGPERACAATLFGMVVVDRSYHALFGPSPTYDLIDPWHLLLDTGGLVALVLIALRANRFFPMILAAAQLVAFSAHLVRMTVEPVTSLSYYLLYTMPFWFQLLVMTIGIARHAYRTSRFGPYRDWRPLNGGSDHGLGAA